MSFTDTPGDRAAQVDYSSPVDVEIAAKPLGIRFSHENNETVLVAYCVRKDANGDRAGIKSGDIVTGLNGNQFGSSTTLLEMIRAEKPPFRLTVRHEQPKKKSKPRPPPMLGLPGFGDNPGSPSIEQITLPGSVDSKPDAYPSWSPLSEPQAPPTPQQWFRFDPDSAPTVPPADTDQKSAMAAEADISLDISDRWHEEKVDDEARSTHAVAAEGEISMVSWNVWMSSTCRQERADALISTLERIRPHVFCLQEVNPWFLDQLKTKPWIQKEYALSDNDGATLMPYGVLIGSRLPVLALQRCSLPSTQGRHFVVMTTRVNGEDINIGTVHLESQKHTDFRIKQLQLIFSEYTPTDGHVAVMGDFNFDDTPNDVENKTIPDRYLDCWCSLHCPSREDQLTRGDRGATRVMKKTGVRYDRVLLQSREARWVPSNVTILGKEPIMQYQGRDMYASDHLGICTVLKDTGTDVTD